MTSRLVVRSFAVALFGISSIFLVTPAAAAHRAYVALHLSGEVAVVDTANKTVVDTVVAGNPFGMAITPDGTHVYVTNLFGSSVSVIETATNSVVATVGVGAWPSWLAITPDGALAYVPNYHSSTVSVIETATRTGSSQSHAASCKEFDDRVSRS